MKLGMITLNQSMETERNYVTQYYSFIIYIITEDFYEDIAGDVERWFDTSNSDENDERSLLIGKNKKEIGFFKDE